MKKIFALATAILLGATGQGVIAQEMLGTSSGNNAADTLPLFELPESLDSVDDSRSSFEGSSSRELVDEISQSSDADQPQPYYPSQDFRVLDSNPALLESTSTWLRRGFWFAEVDAVILNRSFNENTIVLMEQITSIDIENVATPSGNPATGITVRNNRGNSLFLGGAKPGAEGLPRLKLGRFLFRDSSNRDHTAEFVGYGGGQWSQSGSLLANPGIGPDGLLGLQVRNGLDRSNPSFDGATQSQYDYDSRFNSLELNYHIKQRMKNDRMELDPNGTWVRRVQPTITNSFLTGVRYFDVTENLNWDAFGIPDANGDAVLETGNYRIHTSNNLIGTQIGVTSMYETARWSLGVEAKGGAYLNRVDLDSDFNVTGGLASGTTRSSEDNMSFVGEFAVRGRWHLTPNFSIRTGLELLYVNSIALAPFQANFVPGGQDAINTSSDNIYLGTSFGFERYW